ncbi:FtsK/SpoIIIE domain-containing protein [Arthrobacter sp. R4-81]
MTLECTLVHSHGSGLTGDPLELTITAPSGCSGLELQDAVSRKYGTRTLTARGSPIAGMTVGVPPLVPGVVLVDGNEAPIHGNPGPSSLGLMLAVHGGPGAGTVVPLGRGSVRIGRSGTEVRLADAELSREHARLEVSESSVTITDLGSVNGTTVDDKRVKSSQVFTNSLIRCGHSTLSIVFGGSSTEQHVYAEAGSNVAEPLIVGRKAEDANRGTLILTAVLPIVIGTGLAVITGMWMFLAFTAVSALSILVPAVSGRRQRRDLKWAVAAAVKDDQERRRRSAPSAADIVLQTVYSGPQPLPASVAEGGVSLRLGLATQPANVRTDPADPRFRPPLLESMAVTLEPGPGVTRIQGPDEAVAGLIRSLIMQFSTFSFARGTRVLILGGAREIPLAARFLKQVSLVTQAAACLASLSAGPGRGFDHGVLIMMENIPCSGEADKVLSAAVNNGWQVFHCSNARGELSADVNGPYVNLSGGLARLTRASRRIDFVADLVPDQVFSNFCRRVASNPPQDDAATRQRVPEACLLEDVLTLSDSELALRWDKSRETRGLPVSLGMGASGPRFFDLQADGPHLLVAGTTGSGKSELLRSLTVSLALSFPPDRVNFLFVDFKGGSGLGPLTGLPHCVGMLTDLSQHELDRFLISLRAEIRRREELLALAQAPDLVSYRATATGKVQALPHLVLVIDEFRMLVEDAPEALRELMRIAAIGRSLGLHLIMATQRPQGAITPDIRANVTTSIALRVQSELESADIINSGAAARIPVGNPGRAFLARGTEPPEEFQTAALTGTAAIADCELTVEATFDVLATTPGTPLQQRDAATESVTPADAAAPLIRQACTLWALRGGASIRPPVAPALPESLPFPGPGPDGVAELGWVDSPEQQTVTALKWKPLTDGHLGLVGTATAGTDDALLLVLGQMLETPGEAHFYLLDSDGTLSGTSALPHVGAVAGLQELRRGVRVLERVAHEMSVRLGRQGDGTDPPLVLVISGWGSWASALRASPLVWAEDLLQDIVRDGPKAKVTVLISGGRELVTARFSASIPNRCFFPMGSTEEGRLAWPRLPAVPSVRGRAVAFGSLVKGSPSMVQFFAPPQNSLRLPASVQTPKTTPFRVERLPDSIPGKAIRDRYEDKTSRRILPSGRSPRLRDRRLLVGVGGDELEPVTLTVPTGGVLAVLGGPSAGKSTFLQALPEMNPGEAAWLNPGQEADAGSYWSSLAAKAASNGLAPDALALVDDADRLSPEAHSSLLDLNTMGLTIVLAAGFSSTVAQRVPLMLQARSHGTGVLICPRSVLDGDFFGVRFDVEARPPAGRAVVISGGRAVLTQLGDLSPRLQGGRSAAGT